MALDKIKRKKWQSCGNVFTIKSTKCYWIWLFKEKCNNPRKADF